MRSAILLVLMACSTAPPPAQPKFGMCSIYRPPPKEIETGPKVYSGLLRLVEKGKVPFDGKVGPNDSILIEGKKYTFGEPPRETPQEYVIEDRVVSIDKPLPPGGFLETYPFRLVLTKENTLRVIEYAAEGVIYVEGRTITVRYEIDSRTGLIGDPIDLPSTLKQRSLDRVHGRFELVTRE